MVIIMVGSYSLEEGMVYYLAGNRVTDHCSLPLSLSLALTISLSFRLVTCPLALSTFRVQTYSKPHRYNISVLWC
jgi:hypothetical protein